MKLSRTSTNMQVLRLAIVDGKRIEVLEASNLGKHMANLKMVDG